MRHHGPVILLLALPLASACTGGDQRATDGWAGTIDTLASGHVVVHNTADPIWTEGDEWQIDEELRLGTALGEGPEMFSSIVSLEVDEAGRIWLIDRDAQQLRVFDAAGSHVRTIGRRGGGPGEFAAAMSVDLGPDGNMVVADPQNNRISRFDTAGVYLRGEESPGGFMISPWPGRFDQRGSYYSPIPYPRPGEGFHIGMVRYDSAFIALDTLETPRDPETRESFQSDDGRMVAGVPFQGGLSWQLSSAGTMWAIITDQYRLFELSSAGDTLRSITRAFEPLPVTDEDLEQAREDLAWFTDQGGRVDWSKIPSSKAPVTGAFFFDDEHDIWVEKVSSPEDRGRNFDVFDSDGRYLGVVRFPFPLQSSPRPVIRGGLLYGVTTDDLEIPYIVRAKITKSE